MLAKASARLALFRRKLFKKCVGCYKLHIEVGVAGGSPSLHIGIHFQSIDCTTTHIVKHQNVRHFSPSFCLQAEIGRSRCIRIVGIIRIDLRAGAEQKHKRQRHRP